MKRLGKALLTPIGRWQFWFLLLVWSCQMIGLAGVLLAGAARTFPWGVMLTVGVGFSGLAIGMQLKEHLGAYRSALIPGYRGIHIFGALLWLMVVLLPFPLLGVTGRVSGLGLSGPAVLLAALSVAAACRGGIFPWLAGGSFLALVLPTATPFLAAMTRGEHRWLAVAALVAGVGILAVIVRFLLTMTEESPGYAWPVPGGFSAGRGLQARRAGFERIRTLEKRHSIWLSFIDWGMPTTRRCVADSRFRRLWHWQRAHANQWGAALVPAMIWSLVASIEIWFFIAKPDACPLFETTLWIPVVLPPMLLPGAWHWRIAMLRREITYPVRRSDLLLEQGMATMIPQLGGWALMMVQMTVVARVLPDSFPAHALTTTVLVTGVWQLLAFGISARMITMPSWAPLLLAFAIGSGFCIAVLVFCVRFYSPLVLMCILGILFTLVAVSWALAYEHWLQVDLP